MISESRRSRRVSILLVIAALLIFLPIAEGQEEELRELSFRVSEVTDPDISIVPGTDRIVFTLLGDLYKLPVKGGRAVQITRGPYFHKEPEVSPDGNSVVVVSDREPEKGDNLYLMDITGRNIRRLTDVTEAGRPAWSPDGKRIAFLSYERERPQEDYRSRPLPPSRIGEIDLDTGEIVFVSEEYQNLRDVTYAPNGDLHWIRFMPDESCRRCTVSVFERRSSTGQTVRVSEIDGVSDQLRITKQGVFYANIPRNKRITEIVFGESFEGSKKILGRSDTKRFGESSPRFAVDKEQAVVFTSNWGSLWSIRVQSGFRSSIGFSAEIRKTVYRSSPPPKWNPPEVSGTFKAGILDKPVLRPDGKEIAFVAAGSVWRLSLETSRAKPRRVSEQLSYDPAFSPDGKILAYVRRPEPTRSELVITNENGDDQVIVTGNRLLSPSWSRDGTRIVYREGWGLHIVGSNGGNAVDLKKSSVWYEPRFSADGRSIIANRRDRLIEKREIVRFPIDNPEDETILTNIREQMKDARFSANGKWLAFERNGDLWVADLTTALKGDATVSEAETRLFEREAGIAFSFESSGEAILFARDGKIFRAELPNGSRSMVAGPLSLTFRRPGNQIIRNVRVLSPDGTRFSPVRDIFVKSGRIVGIGSLPKGFAVEGARVIDGRGRFAVPGLWDSHLHGRHVGDLAEWSRHGVTSHRDVGSEIRLAVQEIDRDRAFGSEAPRRFYAGEIFEGYDDNWWGQWLRITDREHARTLVNYWKRLDARFIKVYRTMPWKLHYEVASAARRDGLPIAGHGVSSEQIIRSVTLGYRSLEHRGWEQVIHEDILRLMAEAEVFWCPQLVLAFNVDAILLFRDPEGHRQRLMRSGIPAERISSLRFNESPGSLLGAWEVQSRQLRRAESLGVKLLTGTDDGNNPGRLNSEMEMFQDAGLPTLKILRMATILPAMAEGVEDDLGTIETGKLADIILLENDPLEDISNLRNPSCVIRGGRVLYERN